MFAFSEFCSINGCDQIWSIKRSQLGVFVNSNLEAKRYSSPEFLDLNS